MPALQLASRSFPPTCWVCERPPATPISRACAGLEAASASASGSGSAASWRSKESQRVVPHSECRAAGGHAAANEHSAQAELRALGVRPTSGHSGCHSPGVSGLARSCAFGPARRAATPAVRRKPQWLLWRARILPRCSPPSRASLGAALPSTGERRRRRSSCMARPLRR